MNTEDPQDIPPFQKEFRLKRGLSLKVNKSFNPSDDAAFEGEELYHKEQLILMISKCNDTVTFDLLFQTKDINITYSNMGSDGRPALLVVTADSELLAALWRKDSGLLSPVPESDFAVYSKLMAEENEASEGIGEIFSQMEEKL